MKPIVILNAPARTGKDTVAALLVEEVKGALLPFKFPLFKIFCDTIGINPADFTVLYEIEGWKDSTSDSLKFTPIDGDKATEFAVDVLAKLNGHSPREFLIHISETFIKPFFGDGYFGKELATTIEFMENRYEEEKTWIIPDGGFNSEIVVLQEMFKDRVICLQFTREERTFEGDSRGYITNANRTITLEHPNDPVKFKALILDTLKKEGFDI